MQLGRKSNTVGEVLEASYGVDAFGYIPVLSLCMSDTKMNRLPSVSDN